MNDNKVTQIINYDSFEDHKQPVLVVISGNLLDIGRILMIGRSSKVIGRDPETDFSLNDNQISRRHFIIHRVENRDGDLVLDIEDLNSTNGTLVNGRSVKRGWVKLGETIAIGDETILLFRLESNSKIHTPMYPLRLISKDPLTSVFNRRAFEQIMTHEHEKAVTVNQPYCILMLDVDHFKKINDTYGHPTGDIVLKTLAQRLSGQIRSNDIIARVGGEEFAIFVPEQNIGGGFLLAERLRKNVMGLSFEGVDPQLGITISIGISSADPISDFTPQLVYLAADNALYQAKRNGRNRCIIYQKEEIDDTLT